MFPPTDPKEDQKSAAMAAENERRMAASQTEAANLEAAIVQSLLDQQHIAADSELLKVVLARSVVER
jgi:hypothetical protein